MSNFRELYEEYTDKTHQELSKTDIFYAFTDKQFTENKKPKDAPDSEFISIGAGAFIHKSNADKLNNYFNVISKQLKRELTAKVNIEDSILYELNNNEAFYTGEPLEILDKMQDFYEDKTKEELTALILKIYRENLN